MRPCASVAVTANPLPSTDAVMTARMRIVKMFVNLFVVYDARDAASAIVMLPRNVVVTLQDTLLSRKMIL